MLRYKLGDEAFFQGVKNYLRDPDLSFSYARNKNLQSHLEAASDTDLTEFFKDWYYGEGFPSYQVVWSQDLTDQKVSFPCQSGTVSPPQSPFLKCLYLLWSKEHQGNQKKYG